MRTIFKEHAYRYIRRYGGKLIDTGCEYTDTLLSVHGTTIALVIY